MQNRRIELTEIINGKITGVYVIHEESIKEMEETYRECNPEEPAPSGPIDLLQATMVAGEIECDE